MDAECVSAGADRAGAARKGGSRRAERNGSSSLRGSLATLASMVSHGAETVLASNKTVAAAAAAAAGAKACKTGEEQQQPSRWGPQMHNSLSTLSTTASSTRSLLSHVSLRQMASLDGCDEGDEGTSGSSIADDGAASATAVLASPSPNAATVPSAQDDDSCDDRSAMSDLTCASGSADGTSATAASAGSVLTPDATHRPARAGRRQSSLFSIPDGIEVEAFLGNDDDDGGAGGDFLRADVAVRRRRSSLLTIPDELDFDEEEEEEEEEDSKPAATHIGAGHPCIVSGDPHSAKFEKGPSVKSRLSSTMLTEAGPHRDDHTVYTSDTTESNDRPWDGGRSSEATSKHLKTHGRALADAREPVLRSMGSGSDLSISSGDRRRLRRSKSETGRSMRRGLMQDDDSVSSTLSRYPSLESIRGSKSEPLLGASGGRGSNEMWPIMPILDPEDSAVSAAGTALVSGANQIPVGLESVPRATHFGLESDGDAHDISVSPSARPSSASHRRGPSDGSILDRLLCGDTGLGDDIRTPSHATAGGVRENAAAQAYVNQLSSVAGTTGRHSAGTLPSISLNTAPRQPSPLSQAFGNSSGSLLDSLQNLDLRSQLQQDETQRPTDFVSSASSLSRSATIMASSSVSLLDSLQSMDLRRALEQRDEDSHASLQANPSQVQTTRASFSSSTSSILDRIQNADFRSMLQDQEGGSTSATRHVSTRVVGRMSSQVPMNRIDSRNRITPAALVDQPPGLLPQDHSNRHPVRTRDSMTLQATAHSQSSSPPSSTFDRIQSTDFRTMPQEGNEGVGSDVPLSLPSNRRASRTRNSFTVPASHGSSSLATEPRRGDPFWGRRSITLPASSFSSSATNWLQSAEHDDGDVEPRPSRESTEYSLPPTSSSSSSFLDRLQNSDFRRMLRDQDSSPLANGDRPDLNDDLDEVVDRTFSAEFRQQSRRGRNSITLPATRAAALANATDRSPRRNRRSITLPLRQRNASESVFGRIQRMVRQDQSDDDESQGSSRSGFTSHTTSLMDRMDSSFQGPERLQSTLEERRAHVIAQQMRRSSPTPLMRVTGTQQGIVFRDEPTQHNITSQFLAGANRLRSNDSNSSSRHPHYLRTSFPPIELGAPTQQAEGPAPATPPNPVAFFTVPNNALGSGVASVGAPTGTSAGLSRLHQAVSSCAPHETIRFLLRADPSSAGRQNRGGVTPLHCSIDRYDTPVDVIRTLLIADPRAASVRNHTGQTPLDLLWKRMFAPEAYRSEVVRQAAQRLRGMMESVVAGDGCDGCCVSVRGSSSLSGSSGGGDSRSSSEENENGKKPCHQERSRRANAIRALYASVELRQAWELTTTFVRAARHGNIEGDINLPETGGRFRLVHSAAALGCPSLLVRFSAALHPDQIRVPEEGCGRLPLHLAASADQEESRDWENFETITTILQLYPKASRVQDSDGRLALNLAIESRKPWEFIKKLLLACPRALTTRDTKTHMPPFMLSAVGEDADLNIIYRLLRENPLEVSRGCSLMDRLLH